MSTPSGRTTIDDRRALVRPGTFGRARMARGRLPAENAQGFGPAFDGDFRHRRGHCSAPFDWIRERMALQEGAPRGRTPPGQGTSWMPAGASKPWPRLHRRVDVGGRATIRDGA